jgi:hypothetical protein
MSALTDETMATWKQAQGIEVNGGSAYPEARPVFADMDPAKEHIEELHARLIRNAKEKEAILEELTQVAKVYTRESEKAKNLMRRYGVES